MYLVELLASYFSVNLCPSLISLCVAISRDCRINNFQYQSDKALPFSFKRRTLMSSPEAKLVSFCVSACVQCGRRTAVRSTSRPPTTSRFSRRPATRSSCAVSRTRHALGHSTAAMDCGSPATRAQSTAARIIITRRDLQPGQRLDLQQAWITKVG